ncbi:MAG: arginine--tRNA ligase [Gammaproteobacteria bacterium]|nr:arginine--tRNA ligase [Gammaproteobacteria bacterium]
MKNNLQQLIAVAIDSLKTQQYLSSSYHAEIVIERARDEKHGDFACNIAMLLAKEMGKSPRQCAQQLIDCLPESPLLAKVDIAGPGFINFFIADAALQNIIGDILHAGSGYGCSQLGAGKKVHLEYVSSNPTGPLHVGHGRGAAYGASLANLLRTVGYEVHQEYYVNDAGRQMHILATSVWLRYLQLLTEPVVFPSNGYQGDYVVAIAKQLQSQYSEQFKHATTQVFAGVPADALYDKDDKLLSGNKELHVDALIANAKQLLGADNYQIIFQASLQTLLADIREDLTEFGVIFDTWFSEQQLLDNGAIEHCLEVLEKAGHLYQQDDAIWFRASQFGDEKDRVVRRGNGVLTYFASDIAYHLNKLERGYDHMIDVLGADHHGYVPRVKAAMIALANRDDVLTVPLVQFVSLYRGKEKVQMSTRSGSFVTLRELRREVGNDAARFFYVLRKVEQAMDFDLALAKAQTNDNPVYYIQYAHARICSVLRQFLQMNTKINERWDQTLALSQLGQLITPQERVLLKRLGQYNDIIASAALNYEPHQLVHYLRELANDFHSYYNQQQFLVAQQAVRNARIALIKAVQQLLCNGLALLGITAVEKM